MYFFLGLALLSLPLWAFSFLRIPLGVFSLDLFSLFLVLAAAAAIVHRGSYRFRTDVIDVCVGFFFTAVCLSILFSQPSHEVVSEAVRYGANFAFYLIMRFVFNASECRFPLWSYFGFALTASCVLGALMVYFFVFRGLTYIGLGLGDASAVEGRNRLAMLILILLPVSYHYFRAVARPGFPRVFALFALVVCFLALVFTQSRGAWLAVIVAITLYGLCSSARVLAGRLTLPRLSLGSVALFAAAGAGSLYVASSGIATEYIDSVQSRAFRAIAASGPDASTVTRLAHIETALEIWAAHPVTGAGPGHIQRREGQASHNDYIKIAAEFGLLGLIAFVSLFTAVLFRGIAASLPMKQEHNVSGLVAASSLVLLYMPFRNIVDSPIFWVLIAYCAASFAQYRAHTISPRPLRAYQQR